MTTDVSGFPPVAGQPVGWPRCGYVDYYGGSACPERSCHNNGDEVLLCEAHLASAGVIIDLDAAEAERDADTLRLLGKRQDGLRRCGPAAERKL